MWVSLGICAWKLRRIRAEGIIVHGIPHTLQKGQLSTSSMDPHLTDAETEAWKSRARLF